MPQRSAGGLGANRRSLFSDAADLVVADAGAAFGVECGGAGASFAGSSAAALAGSLAAASVAERLSVGGLLAAKSGASDLVAAG